MSNSDSLFNSLPENDSDNDSGSDSVSEYNSESNSFSLSNEEDDEIFDDPIIDELLNQNQSQQNNDLSNNINLDDGHIDNNGPQYNLFQENINEPYMNFVNDIEITCLVNALIFYYDYEDIKYYNIGKKVLAPKYILNQLSKYNNIEYPIHISINNYVFTIFDFIETIDSIYIPTDKFYNLGIVENDYNIVKILKEIPPKATYIKLKPCSEKFYSLPDIKTYLEVHFKKLYPILEKDEIIKLPFGNEEIEVIIKDCKPENLVSMNEIEELEIDFEPLVDIQNIQKEEKLDINQKVVAQFRFDNQNKNSNQNKNISSSKEENNSNNKEDNNSNNQECNSNDQSNVFVPFSGKGRRLCD